MVTHLRVLIIEDSPDEAELLVIALESAGYAVFSQRVDRAEALKTALEIDKWDIILCDYSMPQFDAIAALRLVQAKLLDLPFIIVSGSIGEETAVTAMRMGVHDYLMKDNLARLGPAIQRELKEAVVRAERRQALEELHHRAYYDLLTGLPNQEQMLEQIQAHIDQAVLFAVLYLDIDHYRSVKYGLGHALAEELLVAIARRLETCLRPGDLVARVSTDGFAMLIRQISSATEVAAYAQRVHPAIMEPFNLGNSIVSTSASIGIVHSEIGYRRSEDLLRAADTAMHEAKRQAKGSTVVFNIEMQTRMQTRLQLETDLKQAIQQQQLFLNFQPIVCLKSGMPTGLEALVRWNHPTRGSISPVEFIPLAEETGLITALGRWVLQAACQQLQALQTQQFNLVDLTINVNLSGAELGVPNLVAQIDRALLDSNLSGDRLKLEITESVLMQNAAQSIAVLNQLKDRNINVCIDDFGTGYSSLSYLRQLPINTLKIDRSFVNTLETDKRSLDIVRAILTLAQALELEVVAEGVETAAQLSILQNLGCQAVQGYFFSRPLDYHKIPGWLQEFMTNHQNGKKPSVEE
jgi:diguanylate cyclase (GGDEF)-like protein